jgi:hypothetical protein
MAGLSKTRNDKCVLLDRYTTLPTGMRTLIHTVDEQRNYLRWVEYYIVT